MKIGHKLVSAGIFGQGVTFLLRLPFNEDFVTSAGMKSLWGLGYTPLTDEERLYQIIQQLDTDAGCMGFCKLIREQGIDLFCINTLDVFTRLYQDYDLVQAISRDSQDFRGVLFYSISEENLKQQLSVFFGQTDEYGLKTAVLVLHNKKHTGHAVTVQCKREMGKEGYFYLNSTGRNVATQEVRVGFYSMSFEGFVRGICKEIALMNQSKALYVLRSGSGKKGLNALFQGEFSAKQIDKKKKETDFCQFALV